MLRLMLREMLRSISGGQAGLPIQIWRHPGEGRNPAPALVWVPAFAGMTKNSSEGGGVPSGNRATASSR